MPCGHCRQFLQETRWPRAGPDAGSGERGSAAASAPWTRHEGQERPLQRPRGGGDLRDGRSLRDDGWRHRGFQTANEDGGLVARADASGILPLSGRHR
ncbi:hypothetical protein BDA96_01G395500 [Sorghum bicolor]|uniref:Uncharacterized protein n=2 Tax=Sorghum bicolor TaxID=4558 RepID=A0A921V2S2_SORBI|nr:hypothetical protein BDA96_01G395500 [Sorghum bicolor]KXG39371.1 hypothetical protein SORBI_3001G371600 [Sorghum bicolor]